MFSTIHLLKKILGMPPLHPSEIRDHPDSNDNELISEGGTKVWPNVDMVKRLNKHDEKDNRFSPEIVYQKRHIHLPKSIGIYPVKTLLCDSRIGAVYLGEHPTLKVPVAIKVIRLGIKGDKIRLLSNARNEAEIAAKIDHPNIIRIYDCGEDDTAGFFIVMEYAEFGDLASVQTRQPHKKFDVDFALYVIISVANALVKSFKNKVIHRDIKPQNILLKNDGTVKLADLGLAKYTNMAMDLTRTGSSFGTPYYMAPEQGKDAKNVDHRADIYSLGITFYEFVTGKRPYSGENSFEIMAKKNKGAFTPPTSLEPTLDEKVSQIIGKMMASKPDERYQSPIELLQDLRSYQSVRNMNVERHVESVVHSLNLIFLADKKDAPIGLVENTKAHSLKKSRPMDVHDEGVHPSRNYQAGGNLSKKKVGYRNPVVRSLMVAFVLAIVFGFIYQVTSHFLKQPKNMDDELRSLVVAAGNQAQRALDNFDTTCPIETLLPDFSSKTENSLALADDFLKKEMYKAAFKKYQDVWFLTRQLQLMDVSCSQCEREEKALQKLVSTTENLFPEIPATRSWQSVTMMHKGALSLLNDRKFADALLRLKECKTSYHTLFLEALKDYQAKTEETLSSYQEQRAIFQDSGKISRQHWAEVDDLVEQARLTYEKSDYKTAVNLWEQALSEFASMNKSASEIVAVKSVTTKEKIILPVDSSTLKHETLEIKTVESPPLILNVLDRKNPLMAVRKNTILPSEKQDSIKNSLQDLSATLTTPIEIEPKPSLQPPPAFTRLLPNNEIKMTLTTPKAQTEFIDGDLISLVLRANMGCHVAVLSHSLDSDPVVLFPNTYNMDTRIPAHQFISIPDRVGKLNKSGFKFTVKPPFGNEVMEVIACTDARALARVINGHIPIVRTPFSTIKRTILADNLRAIGVEEDKPTTNDQQDGPIKWGQITLTITTKEKE